MNWLSKLWGRAKSRVQWIIERLPAPEEVVAKSIAFRVAMDRFTVGLAERFLAAGNRVAAVEPEHVDMFTGAIDFVNMVQGVAGGDKGEDKLESVRQKLIGARAAIRMADDVFDMTWEAIKPAIAKYIEERRASGTWAEA